MKKYLQILSILCLACVVAGATLALAGCKKSESEPARKALIAPPAIEEENTLKVGVNLGFAPYAVLQDGTYLGLEVDIAEYVSKKLGLYPEYVALSPDEMTNALHENKIDIALSVPMNTAEANVYGPYAQGGAALYVKDQTEATMKDVEHLFPIGVQKNSVSYWHLLADYGSQAIKVYKTDKEVIDDLTAGKIQAAALDSMVASYARTDGAPLHMLGYLAGETSLGIAVSKDKSELSLAIEKIVSDQQSVSVFDSFVRKWVNPTQEAADQN